jgi:hypothetical protein
MNVFPHFLQVFSIVLNEIFDHCAACTTFFFRYFSKFFPYVWMHRDRDDVANRFFLGSYHDPRYRFSCI